MAKIKLTEEQKQANKAARQQAKKEEKEFQRIESEKNQKPVKSIAISIEWKKSRTWGSNPKLDADIYFKDGTYASFSATCSGCGYDKESTVIADVFNTFLKYKLYGEFQPCDNPRDKDGLPYGIYLGQYRHFSGGIGTNCYHSIAQAIGGKFERIASGKTYDAYKYTDNHDPGLKTILSIS